MLFRSGVPLSAIPAKVQGAVAGYWRRAKAALWAGAAWSYRVLGKAIGVRAWKAAAREALAAGVFRVRTGKGRGSVAQPVAS